MGAMVHFVQMRRERLPVYAQRWIQDNGKFFENLNMTQSIPLPPRPLGRGIQHLLNGTINESRANKCEPNRTIKAWIKNTLQAELPMLSPAQRDRLQALRNGTVTKDQVEVVLAQYDEDIDWSDMYANVRTVYCKGDGSSAPPGCTRLKNFGTESYPYLYHVVRNYDSLADWTVFSQAQAPTVGVDAEECEALGAPGHMHPGVTFHDYVLGGGPFNDSS